MASYRGVVGFAPMASVTAVTTAAVIDSVFADVVRIDGSGCDGDELSIFSGDGCHANRRLGTNATIERYSSSNLDNPTTLFTAISSRSGECIRTSQNK